MSNDTQVQAHMALVDDYVTACFNFAERRPEHAAARAAVEASARQLAEQPGFVMVPVEPTPEMEQAMADSLGCCVKAGAVWADVIAARPLTASPTTPPPAPVLSDAEERAEFDKWFRDEMKLNPNADTTGIDAAWLPWRAWKARAGRASRGAK